MTCASIPTTPFSDPPAGYRWVWMQAGCPSMDRLYGPSSAGWILLPVGQPGSVLWQQARQTEAERRECQKRGAGFDISPSA